MKKRLNITLPAHVEQILSRTAQRDQVPQATKAAYLIGLALELEEDALWDKIAQQRDTTNARFFTHNKVWK